MRYPQLASRNLHYLSRGPRWLGECTDRDVSTHFFILEVVDAKSLQCHAVSPHQSQSKQRYHSPRVCE
jgi:hypothetical protein